MRSVLYATKPLSKKLNVVHKLDVLKAYVSNVRPYVDTTRESDYLSAPRCTSVARRSPCLYNFGAGDGVLNVFMLLYVYSYIFIYI
jgi:hypothetical protein